MIALSRWWCFINSIFYPFQMRYSNRVACPLCFFLPFPAKLNSNIFMIYIPNERKYSPMVPFDLPICKWLCTDLQKWNNRIFLLLIFAAFTRNWCKMIIQLWYIISLNDILLFYLVGLLFGDKPSTDVLYTSAFYYYGKVLHACIQNHVKWSYNHGIQLTYVAFYYSFWMHCFYVTSKNKICSPKRAFTTNIKILFHHNDYYLCHALFCLCSL